MDSQQLPSKKRAAVLIKAAFEALDEAGGSLQLRDLLKAVEKKVELTQHDRALYERSGYVDGIRSFTSIRSTALKPGTSRKAGALGILPRKESRSCRFPQM